MLIDKPHHSSCMCEEAAVLRTGCIHMTSTTPHAQRHEGMAGLGWRAQHAYELTVIHHFLEKVYKISFDW